MNKFTAPGLELPAAISQDVLAEILHDGAHRLLSQAVEAEVDAWLESHKHMTDEQGRRQVVRNGHLPKRSLITGVGPVAVTQPRVHDRRRPNALDEHGRLVEPFRSKILPAYQSLENSYTNHEVRTLQVPTQMSLAVTVAGAATQ